ncbi:MAG: M24 family metallopeptidase [Candidatus Kapabacteria bacterium]|jgi:Xaa-Pro aminopeptidase|nr:M24 family metallopeptidase [Candidatus Kapabacteria bacterium]
MNLSKIQSILREDGIDAWLLYDFRHSNPIAWQTLALQPETHCSRRWAVIIPAEGEVIKIVNGIEVHTLGTVQAKEIRYATRNDWESAITGALQGKKRIALEYSPNNAIPVVSWVDAGTVEWLRSQGFTLESSAEIVQKYSAVWSNEQFEENKTTAKLLRTVMMRTLEYVREHVLAGKPVTEYQVQQEAGRYFEEYNLTSYSLPSVSVNENSANPHYQPTAEQSATLKQGDVLLVDMWAKPKTPQGVYSDITWMAFLGEQVPERPAMLFDTIAAGRDAALNLLRETIPNGKAVRGCDVDDACRAVVEKAGFGQYFIHRTGHSITTETHGSGANIDNFETQDIRRIIPMTSFSIEPGIYIPGEIGLRSEIDIVVSEQGEIIVSGGSPQKELLPLLAKDLDVMALIEA